eukprot:SAG31_NODE_377_length_16533_cov_99.867957_3_plen_92_part_00
MAQHTSLNGVYLDDMESGWLIRDNEFIDTQDCMFIGGGRQNIGKGCYFLVFVQLFEKYGTLIERNTALIEKVSPCSGQQHVSQLFGARAPR